VSTYAIFDTHQWPPCLQVYDWLRGAGQWKKGWSYNLFITRDALIRKINVDVQCYVLKACGVWDIMNTTESCVVCLLANHGSLLHSCWKWNSFCKFPFESELIRRCIYAHLDFLLLFKKTYFKTKLFSLFQTKNYKLLFTLNYIYHILLLYIFFKKFTPKKCLPNRAM
jgi:hypothetical protein